MTELTLPRLAGSRNAARQLAEQQLPSEFGGSMVIVDCRSLKSAPPSFADEVVKLLLVEHKASAIVVQSPSDEFAGYIQSAALAHGVAERVTVS